MNQIDRLLEEWPLERARQVMEQRRVQVISGPGNIIEPATSQDPYFPFEYGAYPHAGRVGDLTAEPWQQIKQVAPADLVPVDPFEPSQFRPGLKLWDATIIIPTSTVRPSKIIKTRLLPTMRNTNTLWLKSTLPALGRVGPLGPNGAFIRPTGQYIIDLMYHPRGWEILEGAHALAHRVGELRPREWKKTMYHAGRTFFHAQRFVTQMSVCMTYGLPFDVMCLDEGIKGDPDVHQYGIEIKSSSYFRTPILRVPAANQEAARVDETLAFVSAGVYIEPHPRGFTVQSGKWLEVNRWSCQPTAVVIAGWELIDMVSHQALCSTDPEDRGEPVCYGVTPADLQPADTFGAYVRYAVEHRGMPKVDNKRYWYVEDWLDSQDYQNAINESPPLPCYDCTRINMRAAGAPARPQSRMPAVRSAEELRDLKRGRLRYTAAELEWQAWDAQLKEVLDLIRKATMFHEINLYGLKESKARRARRIAGYHRRLTGLRTLQQLTDKIQRAIKNGQPSVANRLHQERQQLVVAMNARQETTDASIRN